MRVLDTLPRIAELSVEAARQAGSLAVSVARTVAEPILGRRCDDDSERWTRNWEPPPPRPAAEPPPPRPAAEPPSPRPAAEPPPPRPAAEPPQPLSAPRRPSATTPATASVAPAPDPGAAHVDREAVVVVESADSGAEDGAGAEVNVAEPWDGYDAMKAKDVAEQLATADPATLAVVRLYESAHRRRRTVLAEVDRRLTTSNG